MGSLKGYVPTPSAVVDHMVEKLFQASPPRASSHVLDPGCGPGAFIDGVLRWCARTDAPVPWITGIELDPAHVRSARTRFATHPRVEVLGGDFLDEVPRKFDYVIGNPPYVSITSMSEQERARYRRDFATARGRFDLYMLFIEQGLRCLRPGGRLVFITPEKYAYVETARPLRRLLARRAVQEVEFVDEETFKGLVTYPAIVTVDEAQPAGTLVRTRAGVVKHVRLPPDGSSWMPAISGKRQPIHPQTLEEVCLRISCGVATGADAVFVLDEARVGRLLKPFAHPTIAGRQIQKHGLENGTYMLMPYDIHGRLLDEDDLGPLRAYLERHREVLDRRTCSQRKRWYAFHETPPLKDMLRPKILCKDIVEAPFFAVDSVGALVPRHSTYYIVPKDPTMLLPLASHLNSPEVSDWLRANCQRAANGFFRLQSHVLKQIPVPAGLATASSLQARIEGFG